MEFYVVSTHEGVVHNELFLSVEDARKFRAEANKVGKGKRKIYKVRLKNHLKDDVDTALESFAKAGKDFAESIKGAVDELLGRDP